MIPFSQNYLDNDHACDLVIKGKCGLAVCKKIAKNMRASENERDSTAV
jgi:hypothetical protein